ncbi:MAG TPA: sigma-70 family RNA polymerase sigma factor [Polyangiaceae bacterium]|nr:sigma-70 family RNA polymerase sigma factor [Polyangiaceae bacterium]
MASAGDTGWERTRDRTALTFDEVYREHAPFVWWSVQRLGVPAHLAEDAVQDIFVVVFRRLGEFRERTSIRSWLYAIVLMVVRNYRRSVRRKEAPLGPPVPGGERLDPDALSDGRAAAPDAAAEQAEALRELDELLAHLPDERREVFVLAELEQMTAPEIAHALGIGLTSVYWRLRAARQDFEAAVARRKAREARRA